MSSPAEDRGLVQLFELATPELYRRNAFRVLGLSVAAETGEARRRQKKLKRREALGLSSRTTDSILPLKEEPSQEELQQAQQRIQDPVSRLVDEFFWFWPQEDSGDDDEALKLLAERKNQDAHKVFKQREDQGDTSALHNLAVLYHLTALDQEEKSLKEPLSEAERKTRDGCWQQCYPRWRKLLDDPTTWTRIRDRISELDDPRLTHELVSQIRESLEEVILLISARLAVQAAEKSLPVEATRHVKLMQDSGFDQSLVAQALRRCLAPIDLRIRNACQKADKATDVDATSGLRVARELLANTLPAIRLIDQMLPAGDSLREGLHDEVAKNALRCQIVYGNKTDDWKESKQLLEDILAQLSPSQSLRDRIQDNLRIVGENLKTGLCFFCGLHPVNGERTPIYPMYGEVTTTWTSSSTYRINWKKLDVKVPRCTQCADCHDLAETLGTGYSVGGCILAPILLGLLFAAIHPADASDTYNAWVVIGVILATVVITVAGYGIGHTQGLGQASYEIKPIESHAEYSTIVELIGKGWAFGSGPESANSSSDSDGSWFDDDTPSYTPTYSNFSGSGTDAGLGALSKLADLGSDTMAEVISAVGRGDRVSALLLMTSKGIPADQAILILAALNKTLGK